MVLNRALELCSGLIGAKLLALDAAVSTNNRRFSDFIYKEG